MIDAMGVSLSRCIMSLALTDLSKDLRFWNLR
jgi:hypothetical protein